MRPRRSFDALRRACQESLRCPGVTQHALDLVGRVSADEIAAANVVLEAWRTAGVRAALVGDPSYPEQLVKGYPQLSAPVMLAWRGVELANVARVAIVGSRRASGYGTAVAAWIAEAVARAGAQVVSGGAVGVDAAAHRAALGQPGGTAVVLGCGHAVAYPRQHSAAGGLFDQVIDDAGSIVSECLPYEKPRPGVVRVRNRIVAGLADVVVIVEGQARSGTLLTASAAAEWGRAVLAVPGDVRAPGSVAPHQLLAEGAAPCTSPDDVLDALATLRPVAETIAPPTPGHDHRDASAVEHLSPQLWTVLAESWPRPVRLEHLAQAAGMSTASVLAHVTRARIAGVVADGPDGLLLRRQPSPDVGRHQRSSSTV